MNALKTLFLDFYRDTRGFIVSAELVVISSILVVGMIVGLTALQSSVNGELNDVADAIGSLNQSFCYTGMHGCCKSLCCGPTYTRGSCFTDIQDECDNNQCQIGGDTAAPETVQATAVSYRLPVQNSAGSAAVISPPTVQSQVVIQEERAPVLTPEIPLAPIEETLRSPVVEGDCDGCQTPETVLVPPAPCTDCGGYGHGYGSVAPGCATCGGRPAPMGCGAYGGGCGYGYGAGGYYQGLGQPYPYAHMNYRGYYRVLTPQPNAGFGY